MFRRNDLPVTFGQGGHPSRLQTSLPINGAGVAIVFTPQTRQERNASAESGSRAAPPRSYSPNMLSYSHNHMSDNPR